MKTLNALTLPLDGATLIEASAGTGKTYTITTLFIRLLLEKKVGADQILMVTFTIAATEELRLKIAARLMQAIAVLRGENVEDNTLAELLKQFDPDEALLVLSDVAARLDEVAVYTIDAMCLRVLNSFAFDSDMPLQMAFIANDEHIRRQAAEDYWRSIVGSKDYLVSDEILAYQTPHNLLDSLGPLLRSPDALVKPAHQRDTAEALRRQLNVLFFRASAFWEEHAASITALLLESDGINRNYYRVKTLETLFKQTDAMFNTAKLPDQLPEKFDRFCQSVLRAKTNKNKITPEHEFFDISEDLLQQFNTYRIQRRAVALREAGDYIRQRILMYKSQHGLLHFEDLRLRFSASLMSQAGAGLAAKVRELWPYALVDEAQDTDPQQNHIFQTIYRGQSSCGLFYIGDPKQAIYGFRGADVFTYMNAARQMDDAYTLGVNWRSSSAMVDGVNQLFSYSSSPFLFEQDIVFRDVAAAGAADKTPLLLQGQAVPALSFRYLDNPEDTGRLVSNVALRCAGEIAALIEQGRDGQSCIGSDAIVASDIAVLVKSHDQGREIQQALRQAGVKSATQGGDTVFTSDEALQLCFVLYAIAYPGIETLRRAMITRVLGEPASAIEQRNDTEDGWDALINRFYGYRLLWQDFSLMAAVQMLFKDNGVAERALQDIGGERRLTNLIQLTEILQLKSRELASIDQLLDWLERQIEQQTKDDELIQRLESDEDLVQIVTIHKSKGLEYPIVFMPFGWTVGARSSSKSSLVCYHDRQSYQSVIDLGSEQVDAGKGWQKEEDFSESLRLLYVAVTRAKYLCVIGWDNDAGNQSALAYLLHDTSGTTFTEDFKVPKGTDLLEQISHLSQRAPQSIDCRPWEAAGHVVTTTAHRASLQRRQFDTGIDRGWRITSYTGLQSGEDSGVPDHDVSATDEPLLVPDADDELGLIAQLPAGARTGQVLHEILEIADFTDPGHIESTCIDVGNRYSALGGDEDWQPVILDLVSNTLNTVIDQNSQLRLSELETVDRINEMEFFFALDGVSARSLIQTLATFEPYRSVADGLNFPALRGLMRGFIDLVGRKNDQYFIVDYKSNLLGKSRVHYQRQSLQTAIRAHRYDLQYLIYTVALHRYLKSRLGERYEYQRDVMGVYYLFLRGMKPGHQQGVWFDKPPLAVIEALDACFSGDASL